MGLPGTALPPAGPGTGGVHFLQAVPSRLHHLRSGVGEGVMEIKYCETAWIGAQYFLSDFQRGMAGYLVRRLRSCPCP